MKKFKIVPYIVGACTALLVAFIGLFGFCVAINIHSVAFWMLTAFTIFVFILTERICKGISNISTVVKSVKSGDIVKNPYAVKFNFSPKSYILPVAIVFIAGVIGFIGSPLFNAGSYSEILKVTDSEFSEDLSQSVGTDSIALMDTASAKMLGDREIGSLSDVVSQFDVS